MKHKQTIDKYKEQHYLNAKIVLGETLGDDWNDLVIAIYEPKVLDAMVKYAESFQPYNRLVMAVESKYPNESRFETALRYIQEAENKVSLTGKEEK